MGETDGERRRRLTAMSRSVVGRRVLVTGAASGIGRATAELFAEEGAHVAIVDLHRGAVDAEVADIVAVHGPGAVRAAFAHMIVNLCLPSSSYVNGAVVTVDGGMTIRHT